METNGDNLEGFLKFAGCGMFQVLVTAFAFTLRNAGIWDLMFMAFGNYNPGWSCVLPEYNNDTVSTESDNRSNPTHLAWNQTVPGTCDVYPFCREIIFNPDASTIVTEWALICDRAWIPSIIISIQMTGLAIGSALSGYLSDRFGRKICLYSLLAVEAVANAVLPSVSTFWGVFAAIRFIIGLSTGATTSLSTFYPLEFATSVWRVVLTGFPSWDISVVLFAVVIYLLRDWRHIHYAISGISALTLLSFFWMPESMRWQAVHGKLTQAKKTAKRMCSYNMKPAPDDNLIDFSSTEGSIMDKKPNYLLLFRRSLIKRTIITTFLFFSSSVIYFAMAFGVKALSGNFYLNLILFSLVTIPAAVFIPLIGNKIGRRLGCIALFAAQATLSFAIVIVFLTVTSDVRGTVITVLVLSMNIVLDMFFGILFTYVAELFPTSVRSLGAGLGYFGSRVAGIVAPYLIPKNSDTLHISYIAIGVLGVACCAVLLLLPETKGLQLDDLLIDTEKRIKLPVLDPLVAQMYDDEKNDETDGGKNGQVHLKDESGRM